jgi:hypothetical protein
MYLFKILKLKKNPGIVENPGNTGLAFQQSVVSVIVGVYSFFLGLNVIGMACAHTQYAFLEKSTNESVSIQSFYSKFIVHVNIII